MLTGSGHNCQKLLAPSSAGASAIRATLAAPDHLPQRLCAATVIAKVSRPLPRACSLLFHPVLPTRGDPRSGQSCVFATRASIVATRSARQRGNHEPQYGDERVGGKDVRFEKEDPEILRRGEL